MRPPQVRDVSAWLEGRPIRIQTSLGREDRVAGGGKGTAGNLRSTSKRNWTLWPLPTRKIGPDGRLPCTTFPVDLGRLRTIYRPGPKSAKCHLGLVVCQADVDRFGIVCIRAPFPCQTGKEPKHGQGSQVRCAVDDGGAADVGIAGR